MSMAAAYNMKKRKAMMAEGGVVKPDMDESMAGDDIVDRVMQKRMGMHEPKADEMSADFETGDLPESEEFSYTGANSGDELGNAEEDMDRRDIVARVMAKRTKQRNPSPA